MKQSYDVISRGLRQLGATLLMLIICSIALWSQQFVSNTKPTIHTISNQVVKSNGDGHFVRLTGISAGQEEDQLVTLAVESKDDLFDQLDIHEGANGSAFVQYLPKKGVSGIATITIIVTDNAAQPASVRKSFNIIIEGVGKAPAPDAKSIAVSTNRISLKAFPNPAYGTSRISFSTEQSSSEVSVDMYSIDGVKVLNLFRGKTLARRLYHIALLRKHLPAGSYITKLTTSGQVKICQVILQ